MVTSELIRERTLSGIRAAQAAGKAIGGPKRAFRRDEVVRLRYVEGFSGGPSEGNLAFRRVALDSYSFRQFMGLEK